jgi:hypothetical protein
VRSVTGRRWDDQAMGTDAADAEAERYFDGSPLGTSVLQRVRTVLANSHDDVTERVGRSQVAFRRRRGFAFLWRPGQYLTHPGAEVVLSLALHRQLDSARFKEVAHPAPTTWMHHLELHSADDVDEEVAAWLREAADVAGPTGAVGATAPRSS